MMGWKLSLHLGTIERAPIGVALQVARETGWDGVELRHVDFARALDGGARIGEILAQVQASGLPVTAVGVERGWLYSTGEEQQRLFATIDKVAKWTVELDAPIVMSPVDPNPGDLAQAAASVRQAGDIVAAQGKRM